MTGSPRVTSHGALAFFRALAGAIAHFGKKERKIKKFRHAIDKSKILCYNSKGRYAAMAQLVEHILGKDEVISSNLISSSNPTDLVGFLVCRGKICESEKPTIARRLFYSVICTNTTGLFSFCAYSIVCFVPLEMPSQIIKTESASSTIFLFRIRGAFL